ncbi:MAG: hypothetical protein H0W99_10980 [Acidobacteria bacterium]|nr:hypothetical protein [Acidobacteriota bacterium]
MSVSGGRPTVPDQEKTLLINSRERARSSDPPPTEILSPSSMPTVASPRTPVTTPQSSRPTEMSAQDYAATQQQRPKSNALIIPITIAATVLVLALGGLGAWLLFGGKQDNGSGNVRVDRDRTTGTQTSGSPTATPAAQTPSPSPAPSPVNMTALRKEVTDTLNGWAQSSMERDIDTHMSYYADTLDIYYTKTNVSASVVRADRRRAYDTYSKLDIELSNILITPDPAGRLANAILDKTWSFENDEKSNSGSVQQEIRLAKKDGRWLIIGEKDVQVYYVNK